MEIGVQLWGILKDQREGTMAALRQLRATGVRVIEPCISTGVIPGFAHVIWPMEWYAAHADEIRALGFRAASCHIFADDLLRSVDDLKRFSRQYGIGRFVVKSPDDLSAASLRAAASVYASAAGELASAGASLLLHNEAEDIKTRVDGKTAYETLLDLCQGRVGAQVDVGWVFAGGEDPKAFLLRNEARVRSLHLKDFANGDQGLVEVLPGSGLINTAYCMQFASERGCPQIIDMDCFRQGAFEDLSTALQALRKLEDMNREQGD